MGGRAVLPVLLHYRSRCFHLERSAPHLKDTLCWHAADGTAKECSDQLQLKSPGWSMIQPQQSTAILCME